jgi:hypothetical protein
MAYYDYQLNVTGATYVGNTSFYCPDYARFTELESFNLTGDLVESTVSLDPYAATDNGANIFDIGLLVGTPFAFCPSAGDLIWASNTYLEGFFAPDWSTLPHSIWSPRPMTREPIR